MFDFVLQNINDLNKKEELTIFTLPNYKSFKKVDDYIGVVFLTNGGKNYLLPINHPDYSINPELINQLDIAIDNWENEVISFNRSKDYHIFNFKKVDKMINNHNIFNFFGLSNNITKLKENIPFVKIFTLHQIYNTFLEYYEMIITFNDYHKFFNKEKIFKAVYYLEQNDYNQNYNIGSTSRISPNLNVNTIALKNDIFISLDFNSYHPRLIADYIGFKYNKKKNFYDEVGIDKEYMFKYLYSSTFFDNNWKFDNPKGTEFFKQIIDNEDKFGYKTLSHWAHERESLRNADIIENIFNLLSTRESKIAKYLYDEITLDFSYKDIEILKTIIEIMEQDGYIVKLKFLKNLE